MKTKESKALPAKSRIADFKKSWTESSTKEKSKTIIYCLLISVIAAALVFSR